jgi:ATP-dependent protease ClpP protease subunit
MKTLQIFSDIDELTLYAVSNFADSLEDGEEGVIEIASHGGAVFYGNAAFQKIQQAQNRKCKFIAKVYGIAASSAADIVLSCDRIEMADTAAMMIHTAWGASKDRGIEIANFAQLSVIHKRLPDYTEKDLEQDRWFTAKEALSLGLCDSIFGLESTSIQARLCAKYLSTSNVGGSTMENVEKKVDEVVEEQKEEVVEEKKEDAPSVEEVLEKIAERLDDIEARLVALEGVKAECGDNVVDENRDNARMKAIWNKLSAISRPAASTESVIATPKAEDPKEALERYKAQFPNLDSYIKNLD